MDQELTMNLMTSAVYLGERVALWTLARADVDRELRLGIGRREAIFFPFRIVVHVSERGASLAGLMDSSAGNAVVMSSWARKCGARIRRITIVDRELASVSTLGVVANFEAWTASCPRCECIG